MTGLNSILQKILASTREEVTRRKLQQPVAALKQYSYFARPTNSLKAVLAETKYPRIIAEFKRQSPSKGVINSTSALEQVVHGYQVAGAVAISVLTDSPYFGGSLEDLRAARAQCTLPLLRKDFILDSYQLYEAKAHGADLVLLIAAALDKHHCHELAKEAHELGLEVLLEVHSPEELQSHYSIEMDLLGVNNRSLSTFGTSLDVSRALASQLPKACPAIAESGLHDAASIRELWALGFRGFLIGEAFMRQTDPAAACAALVGASGKA